MQSYARFKKDPSSELFIRWAIARDWPYHVGRLGSLIDEPTFDEVAKVLQWSPQEKRSIRRRSKELSLIRLWSEKCREHGEFPPQEIVDGYLVSSLLRGRYYQDLAGRCGGNYVWHSFRNYVVEPITKLSGFDRLAERLTEVYLAGIVCSSAMESEKDEDVVKFWAENVRRLRSRKPWIQPEADPRRAQSAAVELVKSCDLLIRLDRLERILERTAQSFVTVFGIVAGFIAYAGTGSHAVSIAAHLGTEGIVRPYAEAAAREINDTVTGSNLYLRRLAETGAQRVFAITDDDFSPQSPNPPPSQASR